MYILFNSLLGVCRAESLKDKSIMDTVEDGNNYPGNICIKNEIKGL